MAKSKIADSDVIAYLQERKQSLQEELSKIDAALTFFGTDEKAIEKKGKKKDKKKKLKKAIRKKVAKAMLPKSEATPEAIAVIAATAEKLEKRPARRGRPSAVTTPPIVIVPELPKIPAKKVRSPRTTKSKVAVASASTASTVPASFDPAATMDEKIRYALGQRNNSTKAELIDYLDDLEPSYGLTKLKRVAAFRLNHLLKTGQISGQDSGDGFRYTI
ncbi:hypothetical protein [Parapedobacter koreensis]|uniref:Uncharacterized protein n=1 Tax=Parapedobacter koreensis TaxID=332977 RepID=A0A1H7G0L7_9SPHI|nr:hypothetical protein [Parapedobacter koreensis]SEK29225.1 hypothetical protein SAMN05421740_101458 [Parapedobacter koreensis]